MKSKRRRASHARLGEAWQSWVEGEHRRPDRESENKSRKEAANKKKKKREPKGKVNAGLVSRRAPVGACMRMPAMIARAWVPAASAPSFPSLMHPSMESRFRSVDHEGGSYSLPHSVHPLSARARLVHARQEGRRLICSGLQRKAQSSQSAPSSTAAAARDEQSHGSKPVERQRECERAKAHPAFAQAVSKHSPFHLSLFFSQVLLLISSRGTQPPSLQKPSLAFAVASSTLRRHTRHPDV